jgi:predicted dinucleotide-binding enzyme
MKEIVVTGTGRMGGAFATAFVKRTSHAVSIRGSHAGSGFSRALIGAVTVKRKEESHD